MIILLKPIDEDEINHTLGKLRKAILEEKTYGRAVVENLQDHLKKDQEQMKNMFLAQMLESGGRILAGAEEIQKKYGLEFPDNSLFRAMIVKIDIH